MLISDLEYREVISPPMSEEGVKNICGGFVFIFTTANSSAEGSISARSSVRTQSNTYTTPDLTPPLLPNLTPLFTPDLNSFSIFNR